MGRKVISTSYSSAILKVPSFSPLIKIRLPKNSNTCIDLLKDCYINLIILVYILDVYLIDIKNVLKRILVNIESSLLRQNLKCSVS